MLFLLFSFAAPLTAQVSSRTGALSATVLDANQAPLPAARLRLTSEDTGQAREALTNPRGEALLASLPPGEYTLRVSAPGFGEREYSAFLLLAGQTLPFRIVLNPASVVEKLEVVDEAPVLDTSSPTQATTFGYERMEHSPSQGRNYVNFVLGAPGIAPAAGQSVGRSPAAVWNANNDSGFTAQGLRSRNNSVSIDSTDNRDETTGGIRVSVPLEMVQEMRVAGTSISAELGGAAGGVVNIVTRSGTNLWHGHAEYLYQNEILNARNPEFAISTRPHLRRQQTGASAAGPLRRDRTFLAAAFEIYRENCDEWSEGFAGLRDAFAFRAGELNYQYSGKVQHLFASGHAASLRYAYSLGQVNAGVQGLENYSDFSARGSSRVADHSLVANLTSPFRPTLLNAFTFQYGRRDFSLTPNSRLPFVEIPGVMSFGQSWKLDQQRRETHLELANHLTWIAGRNTLMFGGSVHSVQLDARLANRFRGITLYPSLAAYQQNQPSFALQAFGNPATAINSLPLGLFLNNRWQPRLGLTVETGLRYDRQSLPTGFPVSNQNFAPRFGLAFNPGGRSPWVFRFGAGLFFDRFPLAYLNEAIQKDGSHGWEEYTVFAPTRESHRLQYAPAAAFRSTYGAKLTLGLERKLNADTTLSAEYSHVRGLFLPRLRNASATLPATVFLEQNATSTYDGLTLSLSRRMTSEFGYLLTYTGGQTYDDASDYDEQPQNPRNLRDEWARSRQHQAHRVTATALFEWLEIHLVPTFTFGSGRPLPALATDDTFRTGAYPISARAPGFARNPSFTPATGSLDARLFRLFELKENRLRLQAGIEAYNLLNRSNPLRLLPFHASGNTPLANERGVLEYQPARQVQLFLHLEF
ncbi:MAG: carboxypeptidase regulatory-like domain-containing protein [Bryobacter sp.]|nr:carboxypeptidase regulatory-like domain-containing protein [Bryobacter sp.]